MRLKRLDLKAFGPFTDRTLMFDSNEPGLHIIFGPNEAGKSSSLRGLKALLYGFHTQTPDNFLHSYDQLLVGGCLENKDGQEITFQRRKKRVGDLLDAAGNPMDGGELAAFLHGVEPEIFESLYGIDHNRLVEGGNEILSQKGEVGQALFAAGAGLSSLREVTNQLEQEASDLFKPSGSKPEINTAIKRFKELQREVKEASLSTKDWRDLQKALKEAKAERENLEKDRDHKNKELRRLERMEQAIPELAELKVWQERLEDLGEVTFLSPDFSERNRDVEQEIREASTQLQKDTDRLEQTEKKRRAISLNKALLDHAKQVEDFHQRLGEYLKGQKDRPERNGMRISLRKEASELLKQIRPDLPLEEVESLRPVLSKKKTVQALSSQFEAINLQLRQARKQSKTAEQEMQEVAKGLAATAALKDSKGLDQAVKLARKAGDLDTQTAQRRSEVEQEHKESLVELKRLGQWSGELAALQKLALPLSETVQKFELKYQEVEEERRSLAKDRQKAESELQAARAEIKKIEYGGEVPSVHELNQTREKREQGWQLIRRQWLESENVAEESQVYDSDRPLPDAYEGMVNQADIIADRLRHEAERVANAAALRAQTESLENSLQQYDNVGEGLERRQGELDVSWAAVWKPIGIEPLSPKEMNGWLIAMEKLRYRIGELLKKEQLLKEEEKRRQDLRVKLLEELSTMGAKEAPAGDMLGPLLVFSETQLEETERQKTALERLHERQKDAQKNLDQAKEDLTEAQELLDTWQAEWRKALSGLGLKGEISVHEANDYFDTLQNCLDKVKEAAGLQKRIDGIDRDADELAKEVKEVLRKVAPEMLSLPLDPAVKQLKIVLAQAQNESTRYDQLSEELETLQEEVSATEKDLKGAEEQMAALLKVAKCEKQEELGAIIGRFAEYETFKEKISVIEATLAKIGVGTSVEELAEQAAEVDADELPGQIVSLRQELEEKINPEISRISEEIGKFGDRLKAMDGSAKAAEATEKMEQELARIRRLAERYARVKLASRILQQEIERYREEHQDPLLKIAAKYFADLTMNSFDGLKADVDDKGEPILVGTRPDGKLIKVEGMSDGTRDQLYLALRLASLEWRLENSEPMPFIVDDILINFDDDRSRATLKALADLGKKNQVILFTHHRQIADEAKKLGNKELIEVHEL